MDDRSQDRPEDRRRRGPLGDEEDAEETRRVPQERPWGGSPSGEDAATRQVPADDPASERTSPGASGAEDPETRVIRTPGSPGAPEARAPGSPAPSAPEEEGPQGRYPEAAEMREAHLREVYGGVDWLASFIGCIFAVVLQGILLALTALVLGPLDLSSSLESQQLTASVITGLVTLGIVLFVAYLAGGYVAGRLVRFDGGRNGAATVLWGILLSVLLTLFGTFLPGALFEFLQDFVQNSILPAVVGLSETGLTGLGIIVGALLLELLGGFLGGRMGNRYHTDIDQTA